MIAITMNYRYDMQFLLFSDTAKKIRDIDHVVIVGYYVRHVSSAFEIYFIEKWSVEIAESRYIRVLYVSLFLPFFVIYISSADCWHIR